MHMLRFTPYVLMLWFFCLIFCCAPASAFVTINDSLPYCDNSKTPNLVDAVKSCYHSWDEAAKTALYIRINTGSRKTYGTSSFNSTKYHIITKKANKVHGTGWQCQLSKLYTIYYKTFLRDELIENERTETVKLSPTECIMMVQFKRFNNFPLTCVAHGWCTYEGEWKTNYEWIKPRTGIVISCKIFKRVITAADTSSTLFGVPGCSALQGFCFLKESIITWIPNDIIDECPYDRHLYTDLSVDGNDVLIDSKNSLLFKVNVLETLNVKYIKKVLPHYVYLPLQKG
jgi:hypothetical protein